MEKFNKDKPIEYLAIPYSADDEYVMDFRAKISDMICADLMNKGRLIYAPISSCHHIAKKYGLPRDWKFWRRLDREFIKICGKIVIITLDGWRESTGIKAEIRLAKKYGLEYEEIDPMPYLKRIKMENYNGKSKEKELCLSGREY